MKKILVVNNDVDTMSLLKNWLEKKDYKAIYTGSQEEAMHLMETFCPDLVIVDVLQREVAEKIKLNKSHRLVPLILMTGYTLRQQPTLPPADDFIEKPFDLRLVEEKIKKLLEMRSAKMQYK